MLKTMHKSLSFQFADVVGVLSGLILIGFAPDSELFAIIIRPQLYGGIFLAVVLFRLWYWVFACHAERAYSRSIVKHIISDFLRIVLAVISTIGIYFFSRSLK